MVAAAGNGARDLTASFFYPATYGLPNIVAVAATRPDDSLASFSNWSPTKVGGSITVREESLMVRLRPCLPCLAVCCLPPASCSTGRASA